MRFVTRTSSYRPVEKQVIEMYDPLLVKKKRRSSNQSDDEDDDDDDDEPVRRFLFWWLTFWQPRHRRSYQVMGESKYPSAATGKTSLNVTALLSDDELSVELSQLLPWPSASSRTAPSPPDSDYASLSATFWEELQHEQATATTTRVKTQDIFVSKESFATSWWKRLFQRMGRNRRHAQKERAALAGQRDSNSTTESTEDGLSPDQDEEILPCRSVGHFSVTPSSPRRSWLPPRICSDPRDDAIEVEWSGKGIADTLQQYLEQEDSKVRPDFDDIHPGDSRSIGSAVLGVSFENHACAQLIFKSEDSEDDEEEEEDDDYYLFLFPPEPLGAKFPHPSASSNSQAYNHRRQTEQCDWVNDTIDGAWRQFDNLEDVHDPSLEMVPSPPPMDENGSITDYEGALGWSFSRDDASFSSIISASNVFTPICRHSGEGSDPLFVPPSYYCTAPALLDQDDEGVEVCLRLPRQIIRPLATPSEVSSLAPPSLVSLS